MKVHGLIIILTGCLIFTSDLFAKKIEINDGDYCYEIDTSTKKATFLQLTDPFKSKWSKSVTIPSEILYTGDGKTYTVTKIAQCAFLACPTKKLILPSTITTIGESAFEQMPNLKTLTIPEGVSTVGPTAFAFSAIETVSFPSTLTILGRSAFYDCAIKNVKFARPAKTLTLRSQTFYKCKNLVSIVFPEGLVSIGDNTFDECESVTSITLPSTLKEIPAWFASGCEKLTNLVLPANLTKISKYAFSGTGLTKINLPASLTTIENNAFAYSALQEINVPTYIQNVPAEMCLGCEALRTVTIPYLLNSIGDCAFQECNSLMTINAPGPFPCKVGTNSFSRPTLAGATVNVSQGAFNYYKEANGWCDFNYFKSSGINEIIEDMKSADQSFFNLNGIDMGSDRSALSPGLYIYLGKLVNIR